MNARRLLPLLAPPLAIALLAAAPKSAKSPGIDVAGMDTSVKPGDDFFRYANGTWIKSTEIPADRSSWGTNAMLAEKTAKRTADLITETAKSNAAAGSEARKIGDTYNAFMDEAGIEAKGLVPLKPTLDAIASISDAAALARLLGSRVRADVDVLNSTNFYTDNFLGLWVAQDLSDPSRYAPFFLQGGLGMPDRDYYLEKSPHMDEIRKAYHAHVAAMLKLAGIADADAKAEKVYDLEHAIAEAHLDRAESEDVEKGNNHWSRADFDAKAPGLDWASFLGAAGLDKVQTFVVWHPGAIAGESALVKSRPLDVWKDWLTYHAIEHESRYLPKAFVEERFSFFGRALQGTPKMQDRWKRAVEAVDAALGEAVGKLYVAKYFPASEKARAAKLVKNEIAAFEKRIDALDWMAPETKAKAKAKLAVLEVGVGYPDKWKDYSGLEVVAGDALGNHQRSELFQYKHAVAKLGKPVDRGEWVMNPQLVNAVNLPAMNAMNFPAAMLQPPHFDPTRPEVMDYGDVGGVIGHEISHSFDDQGALFSSTGKLENWWTKEDFAHFRASAEKLIAQVDGYKPFPDVHVNGKLTISENIADLAGLSAAYDAYRISLGGKEAPAVAGFKGDQQFFISFAQCWRSKPREKLLRQLIVIDSHAPAEYRADIVRNLDPWYAAFNPKPGEHLYLAPADRVRVW
jgi:predicted metalloendopeptidase